MVDARLPLPVAVVDAAALGSVRFAVGSDVDLPMLAGVLLEVEAGAVTFVATDRYRMAIHREPAAVDGPATRLIAPVAWVDRLRDHRGRDEPVTLDLESAEIKATGAGWRIKDTPLAYDYPDYRRAIQAHAGDGSPSRALVDVDALRAAVSRAPRVVRRHDGVDHELAVLTPTAAGGIDVCDAQQWQAGPDGRVAVNREFLLQALSAGGEGQLVLELDGPIRPLAIRRPTDDRAYSLLMPVKPYGDRPVGGHAPPTGRGSRPWIEPRRDRIGRGLPKGSWVSEKCLLPRLV